MKKIKTKQYFAFFDQRHPEEWNTLLNAKLNSTPSTSPIAAAKELAYSLGELDSTIYEEYQVSVWVGKTVESAKEYVLTLQSEVKFLSSTEFENLVKKDE